MSQAGGGSGSRGPGYAAPVDKTAEALAERANRLDDEAARIEILHEPPQPDVPAGLLRFLANEFRAVAELASR